MTVKVAIHVCAMDDELMEKKTFEEVIEVPSVTIKLLEALGKSDPRERLAALAKSIFYSAVTEVTQKVERDKMRSGLRGQAGGNKSRLDEDTKRLLRLDIVQHLSGVSPQQQAAPHPPPQAPSPQVQGYPTMGFPDGGAPTPGRPAPIPEIPPHLKAPTMGFPDGDL